VKKRTAFYVLYIIYIYIEMESVNDHRSFLHRLASTSSAKDSRELIKNAKPKQLDAVCEILLNILRGTVDVTVKLKRQATKYKAVLRKLVKRCLKKTLRKKLFLKYLTIVKRLIVAALPLIGIALSALQF
jgi:hypothetical protein